MRSLFLLNAQPDGVYNPVQNISIDIQYATQSKILPSAAQLRNWMQHALSTAVPGTTVTLRIVDREEMTQLNRHYRGKNQPTNVLSFPFTPELNAPEKILGDIVICAPVVLAEAETQHKAWEAHWAHLVIHGCLHLLGFDHLSDVEAQTMESLEVQLLAGLGFSNPYNNEM